MRRQERILRWSVMFLSVAVTIHGQANTCPGSDPNEKQLLWGDLHVHTSHSLDAWAFGALATPKDAYAFARGQPLRLINGDTKSIDRPLDFAAVTDHAETWDQMYLCSDPIYAENAYCNALRDHYEARNSRTIFNEYLLPVVGLAKRPAVCTSDDVDCAAARVGEWRRAQFAANQAYEPCEFTTLIGYEWTGSPGGVHWHRNVIFGSEIVPDQAFDYLRYPEVQKLWQELDIHCRAEDGCRVLTIPHNLNWAEGGPTFAIEEENPGEQALRAKFERLAEIYQEKGASECIPATRGDLDDDCDFNLVFENSARRTLSGPDTATPEEAWDRARSSYYRSLLARGLKAAQSGTNPLMLGAIGSTDTHFGTPGRVTESSYDRGISTLFMTDEEQLSRTAFNPGGLVAVWAEANTREGVFDALYRREAYATSGPRIALRFGVGSSDFCTSANARLDVPMGGTLSARGPSSERGSGATSSSPTFIVHVNKDDAAISVIEIVKGEYRDGETIERVIEVESYPAGRDSACVSWSDDEYRSQVPTYWYARILEEPTPRWSKLLCERVERCEEFPDADQMQRERAWSSPIWSHP